jgi:predicted DCC family thiol-disulfide oxidoreductase YuxK
VISYELASAFLERGSGDPTVLTVLYDEGCPSCRQLRAWLAQQSLLVAVDFVAAASPEARRRYPMLDHEQARTVLTVVAHTGAVYEAERAWLACAWALPSWRPVAEHFGARWRLFLVRAASSVVDRYRHQHRPAARPYAGVCGTDCRTASPAGPASRG